ncbi:MAG: TolB-like protein, partial [Natronomonas sp.]
TQMSPYYFDNDLISANLQRVGRGEGGEYVFEVNVNDDDLKIRVSNKLADFDSEVDRWHVNTEKATEQIEAAEGVDAPAADDTNDAKTN